MNQGVVVVIVDGTQQSIRELNEMKEPHDRNQIPSLEYMNRNDTSIISDNETNNGHFIDIYRVQHGVGVIVMTLYYTVPLFQGDE